MAYTNRPGEGAVVEPAVTERVVEYHDRVRWGPVFAGLVIALSSQLILSAIGAAIGATGLANSGAPRSNAGNVGNAVGIWSIICLFISLFIGGWIAAKTSGPISRRTATINAAILWATTLAISSWLLASGVAGAFGLVGANVGEILNRVDTTNLPANAPQISASDARAIAANTAKATWSFIFGSLLGLAAAMIGAASGNRLPRHYV